MCVCVCVFLRSLNADELITHRPPARPCIHETELHSDPPLYLSLPDAAELSSEYSQRNMAQDQVRYIQNMKQSVWGQYDCVVFLKESLLLIYLIKYTVKQ